MSEAIVVAEQCSKWYGPVIGVSNLSWSAPAGCVIGLLGPNGAGKSTLMKMIVGLSRPSLGSIAVFGEAPFHSRRTRRLIGYCPEHEKVYEELTALELTTAMAELAGVPRREALNAARRSLVEMGLEQAMHRRVKGFSKGMRQRTKLAQCLAHDPDLLVLDEPLTGVDPVARADIVDRIRRFGAAGKSVIVSSHVLQEIEAMTDEILVIHRGQILAEGNLYEIRELIDDHPHRIRVNCDRPRELGHVLASSEHILRLSFNEDGLELETRAPDECYGSIARVAVERGVHITSLSSPDNNLGAVFEYLIEGRQQ